MRRNQNGHLAGILHGCWRVACVRGSRRACSATAGPHDAADRQARGCQRACRRRWCAASSTSRAGQSARRQQGQLRPDADPARHRAQHGLSGSAEGLLDADTNMTYAVKYLAGAYRAAGCDPDRAIALLSARLSSMRGKCATPAETQIAQRGVGRRNPRKRATCSSRRSFRPSRSQRSPPRPRSKPAAPPERPQAAAGETRAGREPEPILARRRRSSTRRRSCRSPRRSRTRWWRAQR